MSGDKTVRL
jgi:WD40 repeat protein